MDFDSVKIEIDHLDEKLNQLKEALNIDKKYIRVNESLKREINNNKKNITNLKNESIESNKINNKKIEKYINEFLSLENPSRELIVNLVEKIYIYQDKKLDIIFTFKNIT